ncbi:hypothetical protein SRHO_G00170640 [Serrasalmus rhombeus]
MDPSHLKMPCHHGNLTRVILFFRGKETGKGAGRIGLPFHLSGELPPRLRTDHRTLGSGAGGPARRKTDVLVLRSWAPVTGLWVRHTETGNTGNRAETPVLHKKRNF